jgi:acyl-CoA synthetase (AMP-forming)/AMP-acid ligase II/acyl carrier protein/NRPS condensation-like uncharacterized protein
MLENLQELAMGKESASRPFSCLAELLAHHARSTPDRDAILAPGRASLSFGKLWVCAQETLRALRSAGIGRDDRVAVVLPDGPDAAAAIISVAAASVCVPLNPGFTADEWQRYFTETRVAALLTVADTDSPSRAAARVRGITVLDLSAPRHDAPGLSITASIPAVPNRTASADGFASSGNDAFILLTSGTTSRPKTIPLTHAAVCLSAFNVGDAVELEPQDRLLSVLPLYHGHGLISGVIATLAAGSSVVCTPSLDAAAFFDWLTEFRPTWYTAVPTIHRAILEAAEKHKERARQSSLRLIRSASSTLPAKVLRGLEARFEVPVIDTFGMTEAATQIAANPLHRRKLGSVGVAAGAEIAILDDAGRQLSPRQQGEIALRGPTITRGYDNDAAATREAFQGGWFRTGDLGYLDQDGYLFIAGRIKEVINRGGQKVAPGEVEQALLRHPDVAEAAVYGVAHERLGADVAAAVVLRTGAKINAPKLRGFVRKRLAGFKVPGLIQIVPKIPKGAGGKIKRTELAAALAAIGPAPPLRRHRPKAAPRSQVEREIAKIWAELLELDQISIEQDVFALGVDSITVTQMIARLRERFGVDSSFKDIFEAPTVAALAARLRRLKKFAGSGSSTLIGSAKDGTRAAKYRPHPVAIVQERMLRIEREIPGLPQFNLPFAYRLRGALDVTALKRSLAEVVRRHDSLRTGFSWRDDTPVAFITPPAKIKLSLVTKDLAGAVPIRNSRASRAKALLRRKARLAAEHESLKPFDMSRAPLFRARLLRLGAEDHVLLLVIHDIVIDGWSMGVLMQEVAQLYAVCTAGKQAQLPQPALRFSDFVRWQRQWTGSAAASPQFTYWRRRLRNASPLFAATGPETDGGLGAPMTQERLRVPKNVLARIADLSHSRGATLFVTLLAAFKALLLLRTGGNDICVATAMANRAQPGAESVVGPFATTAIIRTRIDADTSFHEALDRVRDSVLQAYAHQELPFDELADRLAQEDGFDPESLIQVYFVLQIAFRRPIKLPGVTVRPFGYREGQSPMPLNRTWLTMTLNETPSGIIGACSYKSELSSHRSWVDDYNSLLAKAAANPGKPIGRLADDFTIQVASMRK